MSPYTKLCIQHFNHHETIKQIKQTGEQWHCNEKKIICMTLGHEWIER